MTPNRQASNRKMVCRKWFVVRTKVASVPIQTGMVRLYNDARSRIDHEGLIARWQGTLNGNDDNLRLF
jgi:hypothetical protein